MHACTIGISDSEDSVVLSLTLYCVVYTVIIMEVEVGWPFTIVAIIEDAR